MFFCILTCIIHQLPENTNIIQVKPDLDSVVFEFRARNLGQKLTEPVARRSQS